MDTYKFFKKGEDLKGKDLVNFVNALFNTDVDYARTMQDRVTYRNILYYMGEQWIEYMRSSRTFRRRQMPQYVPTPVDNEIRSFVKAVRAMFLGQNLKPTLTPNTDEREDREAARLGEQFLIWLDTVNDNEIQGEKEKLIDWMCLGGTAFMRTIPEMDGGPWFIDKKGTVIKTGEVVAKNVINFNVIMDSLGENFRDKRWIGIRSLVPREWVEDTFNVKIKGGDSERAIDYQKRLLKLVSNVSLWKGHGLENNSIELNEQELVLFKELEVKPSIKYPKGRYLVVAGNEKLIDLDRMPIPVKDGKWYYTLTDFHYNKIPGKFWSDPGVNDLISPQNKINEIDQALIMNRKGLGRPRVITPTGLTIKRLSEGGQGFLALEYDALLSGGKEPKFEQGIALPQQILEERNNSKIQIQDLSGDPKNIMRGKAPSSKSSGIMVDILRETAEKGHVPDIDRYNTQMSAVYKKRLIISRDVYTENRKISVMGRNSRKRIMNFKGADLRNNTDVKLEIESGLSTTQAGKKQILMDLIQYKFFEIEDPEIRREYLKKLGLSGFAEKLDVDRERAERENTDIATSNVENIYLMEVNPETGEMKDINDDPLFDFDEHAVHFEVHKRFLLSNEFDNLSDDLKEIAMQHTDAHRMILMKAKQAELEQMAQMEGKESPESGK